MKTIIYIPSEKEKELISKRCYKIIDILEGLTESQKYFALKMLIGSFEKAHHIEHSEVGEVDQDE